MLNSSLLRSSSTAFVCKSCRSLLPKHQRRLASSAASDVYDVVVVGGGPAGLGLLTALRSSRTTSHLRTALLETQDLSAVKNWSLPPDKYSNRASSLTPASRAFLERIGAWECLELDRIQPYYHMRVWDGLAPTGGRVGFDSPTPSEAIAYMAENQNLTRALTKRLVDLSGTTIIDKASVASIGLGSASELSTSSASASLNDSLDLSLYPHIRLSTGQTLVARLLVGADGINGPVKTFTGIPTRGWDYGRHGVVATLRVKKTPGLGNSKIAYQRFLPTGPIALLPLPNDYASLVWTTTPSRAAHLKSLSKEDFLATVNAGFRLSMVDVDYLFTQPSGQQPELEWRLSVYPCTEDEASRAIPQAVEDVQDGSIASFPLRMRQASSYASHRVALIGDAAHVIHPLAGQGLNMGLGDAQALAGTIEGAVEHGADIGNELTCLNEYNSTIWMKNWRMIGAVDKLHWLYRSRNPLVAATRGVGLEAVDRLERLKQWFMKQASGQ